MPALQFLAQGKEFLCYCLGWGHAVCFDFKEMGFMLLHLIHDVLLSDTIQKCYIETETSSAVSYQNKRFWAVLAVTLYLIHLFV